MTATALGGGMLSVPAPYEGMTPEQLDTMNALVQLVNTKANQQYVVDQIAAVVGAAPGALDTLAEIAAQLGNDESAITALTNAVAGALRFDVAQTLTSGQKTQALDNLGVAAVGRTGSFNDLGDKASLLDTLLAGLSTAVSTAVLATDSILTAIGKLQGQVVNNAALLPRRMGTKWFVSGGWYGPTYPYNNVTSTGFISYDGVTTYIGYPSFESATFNSIGINVVTAGAAQIYLAVFEVNDNGQPSSLLFASAAIDGQTTGEKIATISGGLNVSQGQRLMVAVLAVGANVVFTGYPSTTGALVIKAPSNLSGYYGMRRALTNQTAITTTTAAGSDSPSILPEIRLQAA